ncbi:class I lanthipeptide [Lacinutrix neustonica]|uniref:Class I lanthipeptide n=1 Tax=Lacinutrix neustonica TaxID=2980107 RepID=A0A9E8SC86_9FLAO|nr:class I lanthipeptide [Lacinutrix neustonica]WAC01023.1 class I lanthipeptide [Lacinutrix neustonica]
MKKQNTKNQLSLEKKDVVELNHISLNEIKGGTTVTSFPNLTTIINFSKDTLCTSDNQQQ